MPITSVRLVLVEMNRLLLTLVLLCLALPALGQHPAVRVLDASPDGVTLEMTAQWPNTLTSLREAAGSDVLSESFALAASHGFYSVSETLPLPSLASPRVDVLAVAYDELPISGTDALSEATQHWLEQDVATVEGVGVERKRPVGTFVVRPLHYDPEKRVLRRYRRVLARVTYGTGGPPATRQTTAANRVTQSVLAEGTWFKVPITQEGIYRIDRAFIASVLGLTPGSVDPNSIRVFGNGGAMLPALNSAPRPEDLVENPSFVQGGGDGRFDEGDYVLFFAKGPRGWTWGDSPFQQGTKEWQHYINLFSTTNYYFIRVGGDGARVGGAAFLDAASPTVLSTFEARHFVEVDRENLGADGGSGLDWMGRRVDSDFRTQVLLDTTFAGQQAGTVHMQARIAVRSNPAATVDLRVNGQTRTSLRPGTVVLTGYGATEFWYALPAVGDFEASLNVNQPLKVDMVLNGSTNNPQAWFDWLEVFYPRSFAAQNNYLRFHTPGGEAGVFEMTLTGFSAEPQVWDVTTPGGVRRLGVQQAGTGWRVQVQVADPDLPRDLVAFVPGTAAVRTLPSTATPVANQNLRGSTTNPDFVIVTPADLRAAADELAEHRRAEGLAVEVAEIEQVYNEFSGGVVDMRAVRDYFRFLYEPADSRLQYALLLGDGHVDYRGIKGGEQLANWIPPYESENTLHQDATHTSDDYFGLLDENEGIWAYSHYSNISSERVDIGIGRFPVQTPDEARMVVAKIKHYESAATRGAWRNRYTFIADDNVAGSEPNERNLHTENADAVANLVGDLFPEMNLHKIYAVSYPVELTAAGRRIPQAHDAIRRAIEEGTLVWNYSGHGGWRALADERLITVEDIETLENFDRLTVFITATCSFGHWDMPDQQSGAERLLLNPKGGAVGVFTTVRLVYTAWNSPGLLNVGVNRELNRYLLSRDEDGLPRRFGDALRMTKNTGAGAQNNNRKFNLLGDPTLRIGLPVRPVRVTSVNGHTPTDSLPAALRALDRVTLEGEVLQLDGQVDPAFDGTVEVAIYDAARGITLENPIHFPDGKYYVQSDLIFRGKARATGGRFGLEFVVPKDISYSDRPGKISLYATAGSTDGFGATADVIVGGTSSDPVQDNRGPRIQAFLNDTTFTDGGLTHPSPTLIVKLQDESGINTVGTGVGHEMLLVIDGKENEAVDLSTRFEGEVGSSRNGTVRYQLPTLAPGPHTLSVRAWDVVNNSGEATLDFLVGEATSLELRNVFSYPNPTTGAARFIFQHNQPMGSQARVQVRIYTVAGRPVRTLESEDVLLTTGTVQIPWDGRDEDYDLLATGVYLYKVRVEIEVPGGERQVAEHIEKLAIIR